MALFYLFSLFLLFDFSASDPNNLGTNKGGLQTYIIHVREPETTDAPNSIDRESWYRSFLPTSSITGSEDGSDRMVYSYQHAMTGFAAMLSEDEVKAMEKKDGFISAQPDRLLELHTTHTPTFLGLKQEVGVWKNSNLGKGVIIGILDTGVMQDHPSFSDKGMPPPPPKWKGQCDFSACNKKIIGARSFDNGAKAMLGNVLAPPSDDNGHGTHTASTAAGAFVKGANVLGNANGTAVGMAPMAHLSIYKVCAEFGCVSSDLLAGLDGAVQDGVDVMSISLGGSPLSDLYTNVIDIGTFRAMQKGIFISCSAGNGGPSDTSVSNAAPWYLTVGASTMDRNIRVTVTLGNGESFDGESVFQPKDFKSRPLPIIYPGANGDDDAAKCTDITTARIDVKGKVVLCERGDTPRTAKGEVVKEAGGAAMVLMNTQVEQFSVNADAHVLPATHVSFLAGSKIKAYVNSTRSPTATIIFKGTILGTSPSPMVASFSSRGPSLPSPGILKPDIIGPGVNVLAGWPLHLGSFPLEDSIFNIMSGTSMSAPHLSGIAALLKSSHPNWSPAAIKSAIMTTADVVDNHGKQIVDEKLATADLFAIGAGHVNPSKASNPGLIYDLTPDDYIPYLCGLGYEDDKVTLLAGRTVSCSSIRGIIEAQLNYPSFSVKLEASQSLTRTVTNVGLARSSYTVKIIKPQGVDVSVKPQMLRFYKVNQKQTYTVTFSRRQGTSDGSIADGSLKWVSSSSTNNHVVSSPILITFGNN